MMIATPTTGAARAGSLPETSPTSAAGRDHPLALRSQYALTVALNCFALWSRYEGHYFRLPIEDAGAHLHCLVLEFLHFQLPDEGRKRARIPSDRHQPEILAARPLGGA